MSNAYIGTCPGCNAMTCAMVDDERTDRKEAAKFCADIIRDGHTLNRVSVSEVNGKLRRCTCNPEKPSAPDLFSPLPEASHD